MPFLRTVKGVFVYMYVYAYILYIHTQKERGIDLLFANKGLQTPLTSLLRF